jgi:UDP-glucose 4-epimerase
MFEEVSGRPLAYSMGARRPGDVMAIYANNEKAVKQLGWSIRYDLQEMMRTAWNWELAIKETEEKVKNN